MADPIMFTNTDPVMLTNAHAAQTGDPRWHEYRRQGITASEIPAVLGIAPPDWESAFSLWWKKAEPGWVDRETDQTRAGRLLEPVVVDMWRDRHGAQWDVWPSGLWRHPDHEWMMATPDRLLTGSGVVHQPGCTGGGTETGPAGEPHPTPCTCPRPDPGAAQELLEAKTSGTYDGWGDEGTDNIPGHYLAQARWQRLVMGAARVRVACMFLPSCQLREYIVGGDEDDEAWMITAARAFLDSIHQGSPPEPDWTGATTRTLRRLHPKVERVDVEVPGEVADRYRDAVRKMRHAERLRDQASNELLELIGDGWRAVAEGRPVATRSVYDRSSVDVRRLQDERPEIAGEYTRVTEVHRLIPARDKEKDL